MVLNKEIRSSVLRWGGEASVVQGIGSSYEGIREHIRRVNEVRALSKQMGFSWKRWQTGIITVTGKI